MSAERVLRGVRLSPADAAERGKVSERRALALVLELAKTESWVTGARLGTPQEDRAGIDIVVFTRDHGDMPLQVKSRGGGAGDYRGAHIAFVVAGPQRPDALILSKLQEEFVRWTGWLKLDNTPEAMARRAKRRAKRRKQSLAKRLASIDIVDVPTRDWDE